MLYQDIPVENHVCIISQAICIIYNSRLKNKCDKMKTFLFNIKIILKWQSIPVFLPGNPIDRGAWWATVHEITKNQS